MSKNNKIALVALALVFLSACAEKEQFEQAVLEQLKNDQDIKDYKINPQRMADCVVEGTARYMPGAFPADPERKKAYLAYTKMLTLTKSKNPQQVMDELRKEFGSAQELASAHSNYTDSILSCQTTLISETEEKPVNAADEKVAEQKPATPEVAVQTNFNAVQTTTAQSPDMANSKSLESPVVVAKPQTQSAQ